MHPKLHALPFTLCLFASATAQERGDSTPTITSSSTDHFHTRRWNQDERLIGQIHREPDSVLARAVRLTTSRRHCMPSRQVLTAERRLRQATQLLVTLQRRRTALHERLNDERQLIRTALARHNRRAEPNHRPLLSLLPPTEDKFTDAIAEEVIRFHHSNGVKRRTPTLMPDTRPP